MQPGTLLSIRFRTVPLAMVDRDVAKEQLDLMLCGLYLHPCGQMPAYEWNVSDVNPPVYAFAAKLVYDSEKGRIGKGDVAFLARVFNKLLLKFH
jgi:hypothetical protein